MCGGPICPHLQPFFRALKPFRGCRVGRSSARAPSLWRVSAIVNRAGVRRKTRGAGSPCVRPVATEAPMPLGSLGRYDGRPDPAERASDAAGLDVVGLATSRLRDARSWALRGARLNASADNPLDGKWRGPTLRAGPLVSRPVSRILSWTAIHLCGRPGPWRVTCKRSCLALHRVGFAQPPRRRDAGALLPHHFTLACAELSSGSAIGGVFLWHFPAGFPGSVSPTTLPCGVRTFLDGLSVPPRLPSLHWRG
jgi:hypothetical protein